MSTKNDIDRALTSLANRVSNEERTAVLVLRDALKKLAKEVEDLRSQVGALQARR